MIEEVILVAVEFTQEVKEARKVRVEPVQEGIPGWRADVVSKFLLQAGQEARQAALGVAILWLMPWLA
jgi:hypothetical protein